MSSASRVPPYAPEMPVIVSSPELAVANSNWLDPGRERHLESKHAALYARLVIALISKTIAKPVKPTSVDATDHVRSV